MATYQLDLPKIIENLRVQVRMANRQELVTLTGIPYTRLTYFSRSAGSTPNPADVTVLLQHFMPGTVFVVRGVAAPPPVVEMVPAAPPVPPIPPIVQAVPPLPPEAHGMDFGYEGPRAS